MTQLGASHCLRLACVFLSVHAPAVCAGDTVGILSFAGDGAFKKINEWLVVVPFAEWSLSPFALGLTWKCINKDSIQAVFVFLILTDIQAFTICFLYCMWHAGSSNKEAYLKKQQHWSHECIFFGKILFLSFLLMLTLMLSLYLKLIYSLMYYNGHLLHKRKHCLTVLGNIYRYTD